MRRERLRIALDRAESARVVREMRQRAGGARGRQRLEQLVPLRERLVPRVARGLRADLELRDARALDPCRAAGVPSSEARRIDAGATTCEQQEEDRERG